MGKFMFRDISYQKLLKNDQLELASLRNACMSQGCFYLDIANMDQTPSEPPLMEMASDVIKTAGQFFQSPEKQKLQWEMDTWGDLHIGGYKPAGKHTGVTQGARDGFENLLIPLNAILGLDTKHPQWPPAIASNLSLFKDFELSCQRITQSLLSALSKSMPPTRSVPPTIPPRAVPRLEDLHKEGELSTSSLAILNYLPPNLLDPNQLGHMAHTDAGSLTLLFSSSPGLQVFDHANSTWIPVERRPGKLLVLVGDTLNFISRGMLKSCLHRVVPTIDAQNESKARSSLVFFLRPELSARFRDNDNREWTGEEWHKTKYRVFRKDNDEQKKTSLLTGIEGFLGSSERT